MKTKILSLLFILFLVDLCIAQEGVLVKGDPPLTEKMLVRYTHFVSMLLDTALSPEQAKHLRDVVIAYWRNAKKPEMQDVLAGLNIDLQMESKSEAEKRAFFARARPEAIKNLRNEKNNPDSAWLVSIYDSTHKPLAQGTVPLMRESVDDYADWMFFVDGECGGPKQQPTSETRNRLVTYVATAYPSFGQAEQQRFSELPAFWTSFQLQWSQMSETEREVQRSDWRKQLAPLLQQQEKQGQGLKQLEQLSAAPVAQKAQLVNRAMALATEIGTLGGEYNQAMGTILSDAANQAKAKTLTATKNRENVEQYRQQMQLHLALYSGLRPW